MLLIENTTKKYPQLSSSDPISRILFRRQLDCVYEIFDALNKILPECDLLDDLENSFRNINLNGSIPDRKIQQVLEIKNKWINPYSSFRESLGSNRDLSKQKLICERISLLVSSAFSFASELNLSLLQLRLSHFDRDYEKIHSLKEEPSKVGALLASVICVSASKLFFETISKKMDPSARPSEWEWDPNKFVCLKNWQQVDS